MENQVLTKYLDDVVDNWLRAANVELDGRFSTEALEEALKAMKAHLEIKAATLKENLRQMSDLFPRDWLEVLKEGMAPIVTFAIAGGNDHRFTFVWGAYELLYREGAYQKLPLAKGKFYRLLLIPLPISWDDLTDDERRRLDSMGYRPKG